MPRLDSLALPLTLGAGLVSLGLAYKFIYQRKGKKKINSKDLVKSWLPVAQVSALEIFPIKSCHGIKVSEAECTLLGLKLGENLRDRCFMVVGENDNFLHARIHPRMVLIRPTIEGNRLKLEAPDMPTLEIDFPQPGTENFQVRVVKVWGEDVPAADCGEEAAQWFSEYIFKRETGARLVFHFSERTERLVGEKPVFSWMQETDGAAFQDLAAYLLLSQASVSDLNRQLPEGEVATNENFRPNIVVSGCEAFAEDEWAFVRIGNEAIFRFMKPCDRCALTTIDPKTGVKNPNLEPLRTLKRYRMTRDPEVRTTVGESPFFGINLALDKPGTIRVGDVVYVGELA